MPYKPTIEKYLWRLRNCADKGDAEGMLDNLQKAVICALEQNEDAFARVTPRTLLDVVGAQMQLARLKLRQEGKDTDEQDEEFIKRLEEIKKDSK